MGIFPEHCSPCRPPRLLPARLSLLTISGMVAVSAIGGCREVTPHPHPPIVTLENMRISDEPFQGMVSLGLFQERQAVITDEQAEGETTLAKLRIINNEEAGANLCDGQNYALRLAELPAVALESDLKLVLGRQFYRSRLSSTPPDRNIERMELATIPASRNLQGTFPSAPAS